jgi:hypothetical protein
VDAESTNRISKSRLEDRLMLKILSSNRSTFSTSLRVGTIMVIVDNTLSSSDKSIGCKIRVTILQTFSAQDHAWVEFLMSDHKQGMIP